MKSIGEVLSEMEPTLYPDPSAPAPIVEAPKSGVGRADFWARARYEAALVYVVQGEIGTPVKVGKAMDVAARLRGLQTGSFMQLVVLDVVPGGTATETAIHRALKRDRLQGEWFQGADTDHFLEHLPRYSRAAVEHWQRERTVLPLLDTLFAKRPTIPRSKLSGMKSADFGGNALGHRWRTQAETDTEIRVRFVEPDPLPADNAA